MFTNLTIGFLHNGHDIFYKLVFSNYSKQSLQKVCLHFNVIGSIINVKQIEH